MKKNKILYVDDEESNLRIFKDTFRRVFDVYTATSGKEGLKILEEQKIDLILSDQRMPEMSGVEFLQHTLTTYPDTNRILVTGFSDFDAVENAINKARVFQYIQKPWDEKSLLHTIEDALRLQKLEKENIKQKEELTLAWKKAEESDRLKTEFLNNISHEIRTPVNGIIGFSELLGEKKIDENTKDNYLNIIKGCSMQLVQTIDNILEFSSLITKQQPPVFKSVVINELIDELSSLFQSTNTNKDIEFNVQKSLTDTESTVLTDYKHLFNILVKLLDNAFKFTEKGNISLSNIEKNGQLIFSIKDTGLGINAENQKLIYDRFTKIHQSSVKLHGGLGLGLSIAFESSKLINATIWFKSEKEKGTTFFVSIPYKKESAEASGTEQASTDGQKHKILIAEDEDANYLYLELLINNFFNNNITLVWAKNGKSAVDLAENDPDIDMVFMDIKMPLMDGLEATKTIKDSKPGLPIIAQTAYSTSEDKRWAKEAGCEAFISKPYQKKEIDTILNQYFSKKVE